MWHSVGHVVGGGAMSQGLRNMAGVRGGDMLQGLGTCGRVWGHVAGGGSMWHGVGSCGRGGGM